MTLIFPFPVSDLILRILEDAKEFDTRIWIAAVAIGKLTFHSVSPLSHLESLIVLVESDVLLESERKRDSEKEDFILIF